MSRLGRLIAGTVVGVAMAVLLAALVEGGARVAGRLRDGQWPQTYAERTHADAVHRSQLYTMHPYLNAAPRPGASSTVNGRHASFNSSGYRSAERPRAKPDGVRRVLTVGGSTTFDLLADDDPHTWPAQLERLLTADGERVEVWNAGFPGWTSAENLIAFSLRDADLAPDVVVLLQGFNDLQPAAHRPFDPQYVEGHAAEVASGLGLVPPVLRWSDRSVALEIARNWLGAPPPDLLGIAPVGRHMAIDADAPRVYERNLTSFLAVVRAHGATPLLVTQPLRLREGDARRMDLGILAWWIRGLESEKVPGELERLNDVTRAVAAAQGVALADAARDVAWTDADFGDAVHYSPAGSTKLAAFLRGPVESALAAER
jgi:hypothetical protein